MKITVQCIGSTLLMLTLSTACASQSNDSLVFTIEQALVTSPGGADLGRSVGGDWDRMCIFRPGTPAARVDSVLGASWRGVGSTRIGETDSATLLVFASGTSVVEHAMYPIAKGDFGTPGPEQWYCLPRERAVFELRQPIDGSIPWIGPAGS